MQPQQDGNAVKEAAKKERQPTRADDLSSIHNNSEIGTSGGDQRQNDAEAANDAKSENLQEESKED